MWRIEWECTSRNNINSNNAPEMFNRVTLKAKDGTNRWRKAERLGWLEWQIKRDWINLQNKWRSQLNWQEKCEAENSFLVGDFTQCIDKPQLTSPLTPVFYIHKKYHFVVYAPVRNKCYVYDTITDRNDSNTIQ
jgi:hypothetical protein